MNNQKDSLQTIIREKQRRLQILKERQAKFGINTPPEIITEIEDLEAELEALREELLDLRDEATPTSPSPGGRRIQAESVRLGLTGCSVKSAMVAVTPFIIVGLVGYYLFSFRAGDSTSSSAEATMIAREAIAADATGTAEALAGAVEITPTNSSMPVGCPFQEDTNPPHLTIAELWYTVGDEPEQRVTSGGAIKLSPNQSLCVRYLTYTGSDSTKPTYGVWSEVIIRKDDWDFNDLRPIDAVPAGVGKPAALANGPGCWTTVADMWSELSAQLIQANEPGVGCEVDDRLFVALVITATAPPTPNAPRPPPANEIVFDAPVSGQLDSPLESDTYTFSGAAGDLIWVRLIDKQITSFFPQFRLNDSAGNEVCAAQSSSLVDKVCSLSAAGPHKLFVENSSGNRHGPYDLYLQRINDPVGVQPITLGAVLSGDLDSPVELDGYSFEASAGAQVLIRLFDKGQTDFFPVFWLYDSQGSLVCSATASSEAKTTCKLELGGVYVVYAGNSSGNNTGAYDLVVQLQ